MENGIFVSYSHKDADVVGTIVATIKKATDMGVWYDSSLRGGQQYFSVIAEQIMESKFFAFIVSGNSVASEWCLRELEYAVSKGKTIVAIWLEKVDIPPRVELTIQNTHYIRYDPEAYEAFFDDVGRAFLENASPQQTRDAAENEGRDLIWKETYFLDSAKLKKIRTLLSNEKQSKYSVCFQPENAYLLGLAYELGIKVDADPIRAEFYYRVSAYKGNADGKYLYAAIRSKQPDADQAALLEEMIDAAEQGSIFALTYLGDDYYYGRNGCDKDPEKAYGFWKQAVDAGGVVAMYYMAYGHRNGDFVPKDFALAYMYALMATEYGFPRAYRLLAFMYERGEMVQKDYDEALRLFEEAVKRGDHLSLCHEGWIYGQKKNFEKQRELYEKAAQLAEAGEIDSGMPFYRMGYLYEYGNGVRRDTAKAAEYYLRSAERKYPFALKYTVRTIGKIGDPELKEAYLHEAYALGCEGAAYALGNLEKAKGDGKTLPETAIAFYVKGAESGHVQCMVELIHHFAFVLSSSKGGNNRLEAIKWFQFFFAHAGEEYLKFLRGINALSTYYYAYAVELDYDPGVTLSDREFARLYFQKSLDESPAHLHQIVSFIVDGYLFPKETSSGLTLDVLHAEKMLALSERYLPGYYQYLQQREIQNARELWEGLKSIFRRGYQKLAECYQSEETVQRNRETSKQYRDKAEKIVQMMENIQTPASV